MACRDTIRPAQPIQVECMSSLCSLWSSQLKYFRTNILPLLTFCCHQIKSVKKPNQIRYFFNHVETMWYQVHYDLIIIKHVREKSVKFFFNTLYVPCQLDIHLLIFTESCLFYFPLYTSENIHFVTMSVSFIESLELKFNWVKFFWE